MCILCVIQKWSRRVASMLPWLVIPLIGLWFLSQFLPPAFRFEIMSPRLACVFVLLIMLFWYEILMPQLSAWRLRRNARLRERKRFEAIEMQKLRKTATRRCRNCLTPYRDQNPGGGKFMCSYCGHISKRPVLDLPVPPGLGLSNSGILKDLVGKGGKMLNENDQYHQFEMDTRILQELGIKAYRFSISWPRILPNGRIGNLNKGVNKEGVAYYNNLINALKARDIEPYVTLFHWDLPQALDDKYGGFLSESIRDDFKNYADFCFKEFGDRVKHWCTINEPYVFSWGGYALGTLAPGHGYPPTKTISNTRQLANPNAIGISNKFFRQIETMVKEKHPQWIRTIPPSIGDAPPTYSGPATEPYAVGYNLLLCHVVAYNLYQQNTRKLKGGRLGLPLIAIGFKHKMRVLKLTKMLHKENWILCSDGL